MASLYCQELIRNSKTLCENYIGEILKRTENGQQPDLTGIEDGDMPCSSKLGENYYLEDDRKLLNVLIKNCQPILTDLLAQVDKFNSYN